MKPPTRAQLDAIVPQNIPDENLKLLIYRSRENANSDPTEVALAYLAHSVLALRAEIAILKKKK